MKPELVLVATKVSGEINEEDVNSIQTVASKAARMENIETVNIGELTLDNEPKDKVKADMNGNTRPLSTVVQRMRGMSFGSCKNNSFFLCPRIK